MTHAIRVLAETSETVTIGRSDFEALVQAAEDAEDLAAPAEHHAEEARIGRDAARRDYLSADETERLVDGENPVTLWRRKRGLSQRALARARNSLPMRKHCKWCEIGGNPSVPISGHLRQNDSETDFQA